jgi:hypothetical protein
MDKAQVDAAALMEASLIAVADAIAAGAHEIRFPLFERFFAAFPERRATFYTLESSSRRMTDETVQMLYGLAAGEGWVPGLVNELSYTHRQYGVLPQQEYDVWVDLTVDVLRDTAGAAWCAAAEAAWRMQAERLKAMVAEAKIGWVAAMAPS